MVGLDSIRRSLSRGRSHSDPEDHTASSHNRPSRSTTPRPSTNDHHDHHRHKSPFGSFASGIAKRHHRHHHHHGHHHPLRSRGRSRSNSVGSQSSQSSDDDSHIGWNGHSSMPIPSSHASLGSHDDDNHSHRSGGTAGGDSLPPPILVYHESARSIVFRDHVRRVENANVVQNNGNDKKNSQYHQMSSSMSSPGGTPRSSSHQNPLGHRHTTIQETSTLSTPDIVQFDNNRDTTDGSVHSAGTKSTDGGGHDGDWRQEGNDAFHALKAQNHRKLSTKSDTNLMYFNEDVSNSFSNELSEMAQLFGAPESLTVSADSTRSLHSIEIAGFQPTIEPLPKLSLEANDEFEPLLESTFEKHQQQELQGGDGDHQFLWSEAEKEVYQLMMDQRAVVKTIKNSDWTPFLNRFKSAHKPMSTKYPNVQDDIPAHDEFPFVSFCTPCSLLPPEGKKMRAYGANSTYTTGVVFALPLFSSDEEETEACKATRTWSWPSGYAAKTEFNRNERGELINGREEALMSLSQLRSLNNDYISKEDYVVAGRMLKGGLKTVPYNEIFVRVGGPGRIVNGKPVTGVNSNNLVVERSFDRGLGLPVALFVRTAQYGHLISLLRTRARLQHVFGEKHVEGLPLLMITPEGGLRVLTEALQHRLLKIASRSLNPFQNPLVSHKTTIKHTDPEAMEVKMEELLTFDDKIRQTLTKEELARIAGGFGATDESIAVFLRDAMIQDKHNQKSNGDSFEMLEESHELQDIVNEGLASAVRAGDYHTSRQLLILYSLVASEANEIEVEEKEAKTTKSPLEQNAMVVSKDKPLALNNMKGGTLPPPPPLDTDRLRAATNVDGLLAVLGAAQILKAIQDGSAKRRTEECFVALEEWIEAGESSIAFRLASWTDQRAAQKDLEIAVNADSSFMAFVSGKAISNRKNFATQLREAVGRTDFSDMRFLTVIYEITSKMHSPCLRLELLQYALGLDNRYSIAHVKRAVELAATCLSISLQRGSP